jgi:single-strand DNA-binding protein
LPDDLPCSTFSLLPAKSPCPPLSWALLRLNPRARRFVRSAFSAPPAFTSPKALGSAGPPNKALHELGSGAACFRVPQEPRGDKINFQGEQTMYMNQLTLIGFTGQDAELHYTQNGVAVITLSVATKESWKNGDGQWQSRTEWHRIVAFGKLAEYAQTLPKGSHVLVQGSLRSREYDRDDVKHRVVELRADSIAKLDRAVRREANEATVNDA